MTTVTYSTVPKMIVPPSLLSDSARVTRMVAQAPLSPYEVDRQVREHEIYAGLSCKLHQSRSGGFVAGGAVQSVVTDWRLLLSQGTDIQVNDTVYVMDWKFRVRAVYPLAQVAYLEQL